MTSILTNTSAMAALQTLRGISSKSAEAQQQISSGMRVETAADNAAYWSIATTMRSDNKAISSVADALSLGAAKVDITYAGLESTTDILSEFRAKLVAAKEPGVDKGKIQKELKELQGQIQSVAASASFNGVNWLETTDPRNLLDISSLPNFITSSFIRGQDGAVSVGQTEVDVADLSLFNVGGGGALQSDPRSLGNIGGFRNTSYTANGTRGQDTFAFSGAFTLAAADSITFNLTLDASSLSSGTTYPVTINRSLVNAALGTTDGVISNAVDYSAILNKAFANAGIPATSSSGGAFSNAFTIASRETTGHPGSSVSVSNVVSSMAPGTFGAGLQNTPPVSIDNSYPVSTFTFTGPFKLHRDVAFTFDIQVGNDRKEMITISRDMADQILGAVEGEVTSAADMAALLSAALQGKGIEVTRSGGQISLNIDKSMYPTAGTGAFLSVTNVQDTIGQVANFGITDVDITDPNNNLDNYLTGVDIMLQKVITGASTLGAVKARIDMQQSFTQTLMDTIDEGVGRLVDTEMNEASTRLKALQTQEQLGIQSLQIANSNSQNILKLFQ